jgi:hypothetical protein
VLASARPADADWCRRAGADAVFDYSDPRLAERLRQAAPGGVDLLVDTSGHLDLDMAVGLLAQRGRIVVLAGRGQRPALPVGPLYLRGATITGFAISDAHVEELAEAAGAVNARLAAGTSPSGSPTCSRWSRRRPRTGWSSGRRAAGWCCASGTPRRRPGGDAAVAAIRLGGVEGLVPCSAWSPPVARRTSLPAMVSGSRSL